jgi:hypothetical protein
MGQETLEEAAEKYARKQCDDMYDNEGLTGANWGWETLLDFIAGAKWQQEQSKEIEKRALAIITKFVKEFDEEGEVSWNTRDEAQNFLNNL